MLNTPNNELSNIISEGDTDIWVMGIFTYYLMDKGYATGELYFPPYYEIAIQAFNTIRDNVKKNQYKEKLKGNVKNRKYITP